MQINFVSWHTCLERNTELKWFFLLFLQPPRLSSHHPVLKMAFIKCACFWVETTTSHAYFLVWILPCLPRVLIFLERIYSSPFLHNLPSSSVQSLQYWLQRFNCGFLTEVTLNLHFIELCLNYFKTPFIDHKGSVVCLSLRLLHRALGNNCCLSPPVITRQFIMLRNKGTLSLSTVKLNLRFMYCKQCCKAQVLEHVSL